MLARIPHAACRDCIRIVSTGYVQLCQVSQSVTEHVTSRHEAVRHCICHKHQHAFEYFADGQHSSLMLYRTKLPEYKSAEYLSVVKCASNRRLISRFRTGCHDLRVDTGRWANGVHLDRTDRLCLVCKSLDCVEDEQHFVFYCPAYSHIRSQHLDLLQHCCTIADFMTLCEPNACGGFLRGCFARRKQILSL